MADDQGRFDWEPKLVRETVFPYDKLTDKRVEEWMDRLVELGFVLKYAAKGLTFGFLPGWFEHQYIRKPMASALPKPPVSVHSWAQVETMRKAHFAETGEDLRVSTMLRQYEELGEEAISVPVRKPSGTKAEPEQKIAEPDPVANGPDARAQEVELEVELEREKEVEVPQQAKPFAPVGAEEQEPGNGNGNIPQAQREELRLWLVRQEVSEDELLKLGEVPDKEMWGIYRRVKSMPLGSRTAALREAAR
jgi:hypothetical protein